MDDGKIMLLKEEQRMIKKTHPLAYSVREKMFKYFQDDGNGFYTGGGLFFRKSPKLPYLQINHDPAGKVYHPEVLLSAPHAVIQTRLGKRKNDDFMTGPIVEALCERTGCMGMVRTKNLGDDPNYDLAGPGLTYKEALADLACEKTKIFLDIHGTSNERPFDFCLGTNYGGNLNWNLDSPYTENPVLRRLEEILSELGRTVIDFEYYDRKVGKNVKFCASRNGNESKYMAENCRAKFPCIQLEIAARFRKDPEKIELLINALETFIKEMFEL